VRELAGRELDDDHRARPLALELVDGSPYARSRAAVRVGNLAIIEATAAELGWVALRDALGILLVIEPKDDELFERSAIRWAARLALEVPDLVLAELGGALESCGRRRVRPAAGRGADPLLFRSARRTAPLRCHVALGPRWLVVGDRDAVEGPQAAGGACHYFAVATASHPKTTRPAAPPRALAAPTPCKAGGGLQLTGQRNGACPGYFTL
jgi:hypothetical protein